MYIGHKKPKSKKQRGYYWGTILPVIANYTGYTVEECHKLMKEMFLKVKPEMSGIGEKVLSTEALTTRECSLYYSKIRHYWREMGVIIPDPEDAREVQEDF